MDLETVLLSEVSQTEKEKYHDISYMCNLKRNDTNDLIFTKQTELIENELTVARGKNARKG